VLVPRRGWCEPSCTRCGQVCPTGALARLTPETKGWTRGGSSGGGARVKIGTAFFDWGRCLPWAMAAPCVVCEEVCPTSPKAIWLEPVDAVRADGRVVRVQRPRLDPDRCIGCGLCEAKCPVASPAAIRVTRAGESRDPKGGFTLGRPS
jgi:formate hydrogenlyase subunit 6/NADH:ubiquinone oxidoreductase subunit I